MRSANVSNDTETSAAASQTQAVQATNNAPSPPLTRKASTPAFRTLRRMPSRSNLASNATTAWTVGQQKPSSGQPSTDGTSELHASQSADAKSKFMRAIGKLKSKHLPQKKGAMSVASNNSTGNDIEHNATSDSNRSSVVLPSSQHHDLSITSADLGSRAQPAISDSASVSMRSYVEPVAPKENSGQLQLHDIDMEDSDARRTLSHDDRSAPSSLRVKFKNRVNTTLASFKSSSSLREKARSQQAYPTPLTTPISASISAPSSPLEPYPTPLGLTPQQLRPSSAYIASDSQQANAMLRLSKPFWTIPRVRPESSSSSKLAPWTSSSRAGSIAERMSFKSHQPEPEAAVISPKLSPVTSEQQQPHHEHVVDEESDSDESIDIITQADYNDYTQFAELPLKKRKKLEAAAAAAAAAAAQDPSGKRPSAMKRFLMPHKAADDKKKMHESGPTLEELAGVPDTDIPQRNSKKRPKDQDSIEQKQQQMSNKMAKSNSQEPSEWRKAIIKSLHLGKITKKSKNSSPNSPMEPTTPQTEQENPHKVLQQEPQQDNAGHLEHQIVRIKRSDSVNSTRSRSLDTSSHPALLATTVPPMGTRRETLEMAIHKRRRSSAVRSSAITPVMGGLRPPGRLEDEAASMHVTHTFTSFTLELADVQHAQAVVNNSAVPGLFDFKRQPRLTMSSMHTDQEFKGFDSDGDAMSGYTGDADVSMEEISLHPRTPIGSKFVDKGKLRESGPSDYMLRRRVSSGDIDSDTLPELPSLAIRRELGRNGSSSRGHMKSQSLDISGRDSPRTLRRMGSATPTLNRKPSRNLLSGGPITVNVSPATTMTSSMSSRHLASQPSLEEISHWKARGGSQYNRPTLPALNTKGLPANRGSAKNGLDAFHQYHHQRQPSSAHLQQSSGDTLLPHHLKNFSTGSTLSASTVYSTHTLNGHGQAYSPTTYQAKEFDPNRDFDPDSPVDLKAMDFETLLKTAEREQLRGREERTLKKKKSFQFGDSKPFKFQPINPSDRQNVENFANGFYKSLGPLSNNNNNHNNNNNNNNNNGKSALSALMESTPNRDEVRGRGSDASFLSTSSLGQYLNSSNLNFQLNKGKPGGFQQPQTGRPEAQRPTSSLGHYRTPITKGGLTFELSESAIMSSTGGSRGHTRSRRVMKKKTSVIKLTGKVQGRREDDGMIRVTVAPDSHQWAA